MYSTIQQRINEKGEFEKGTFYNRLKSRIRNIFGQNTNKTQRFGILGNLKEGTREYKDGTIHKGKFDIFGNLKEGTIQHKDGKNFEYVKRDGLGGKKTIYFDKDGNIYKTETKRLGGIETTLGRHDREIVFNDDRKIRSIKTSLKSGQKISKKGNMEMNETGTFNKDETLDNGVKLDTMGETPITNGNISKSEDDINGGFDTSKLVKDTDIKMANEIISNPIDKSFSNPILIDDNILSPEFFHSF